MGSEMCIRDSSWTGCGWRLLTDRECTDSNYHSHYEVQGFYSYSEGPSPYGSQLYGGWENISIDFELTISTYGEANGYSESSSYHGEGIGTYSVWPSSVYEFTLYYRFVPVIPVE